MVDDFIDCKHGRKPVENIAPGARRRSSPDTYGVIVYQEQVMQIAQVLAGYSLGGADLLRRAMGKKKRGVWQGEGRVRRRRRAPAASTRKIADEVFDLMEFFAGYGFNKSHSAAYG